MTILAASIEASGWVLRLDISGTLGDYASYALTPDATPKIVVQASHPGFVKSAGTAIAGTIVRDIVGMVPIRKPVDRETGAKVIDETDLGGGSIRVRLVLSENIYATNTGLTLTALAGWRTGEGAASMAVTNNSTLAAPMPIMRWALPPYDVATGSFRVSMLVAGQHPVGFEPVAGIKFTATDGTSTKTVWVTSLGWDNSYSDNLRCYTAMIDPTGLNAGLLRIDAEVYPWLGSMRPTDAAGTKSMATLQTDGWKTAANSPWVIGYDPAGTRYSGMYLYVDPTSTNTTASAAMVQTSHAAAKALAVNSRPKDIATAMQSAKLFARSLPAANGVTGAAAAQSLDHVRIRIAAGTHAGLSVGATQVTTGATCTEIPCVIEGDPDDASPRANCIINTGGTLFNTRSPRLRWKNLTMKAGGTGLHGTTTLYQVLENVTIEGLSGSESATTAPIVTGAAPTGQSNIWAAGCRFWRYGWTLQAANRYVHLNRNNEFSRRMGGIVHVKSRWISKAEDGFTAANTNEGMSMQGLSTDLGGAEDIFVAYNDMRNIRWTGWTASAAPTSLSGTAFPSHRRHVLLGNVWERTDDTGTSSDVMWSYGETGSFTMSDHVFEFNTNVGTGYNCFYSDPIPVTLADTDSQYNEAFRIRHANNATDRNASKQDDFNDPSTLSVRRANGQPTAQGYRPQMIFAWANHFGVGNEAHVDYSRNGSPPNFFRDYSGLRSVQYASATAPNWTDDRGQKGTNTGGGDYRPTAASAVLGRVKRGNTDVDFAGVARVVNGASGAFEYVPSGVVASAAIDAGGRVAGSAVHSLSIGPQAQAGGAAAYIAARAAAIGAAPVDGGGRIFALASSSAIISVSVATAGGGALALATARDAYFTGWLDGGGRADFTAARSAGASGGVQGGGAMILTAENMAPLGFAYARSRLLIASLSGSRSGGSS